MGSSPASLLPAQRDVTVLALLVALLAAMASHAHVTQAAGAAATSPIASCAGVAADDARVECLEHALDAELRASTDLATTLAAINGYARRDALLASRCHMLLHEQGRIWSGTLDPGTIEHDGKDCAAGFLHGWMIDNLGAGGRLDRSTVDSWCDAVDTPLERSDCEHGMGHVLVRNLRGELRTALTRCRALGDTRRFRNCAGGAFMENRAGGRGRDGAAATTAWSAGEAWRPCRVAPRDLLDACAAWAVRDVKPARRLAWCASLAARVDRRPCQVGLGASAPVDRSGARVCRKDAACWYGRGYAWAMLGWQQDDDPEAAARCMRAPQPRLRRACGAGVGFRRGASLAGDGAAAAARACEDGVHLSLRSACISGARGRDAAVAWA